jgi:transcriptional regulator with XRE-family HTH domain
MARKKGNSYVVDDDWRNRVETRLVEMKMTRADLARDSKIGRSTISDLLNGKTNECVGLPAIHKALKWDPPLPPILSPDASELFGIWDRLDDFERGRLLERARSIFEGQQMATRTGVTRTKG